MRMLKWMRCGIRLDRIRNKYVCIKICLGVINIGRKIKENRLRWVECIERIMMRQ